MGEHLTSIDDLPLTREERERIRPVTREYKFRVTKHYASLIDWNDPDDPLRRIVVPSPAELDSRWVLDPSGEERYMKVRGLEHKYADTALLLVSSICDSLCRYCFRKRLFLPSNDEVENDLSQAIPYIAAHPEIRNAILSGGDPLTLSTRRLDEMLTQLCGIEHLQTIRIGSKALAFRPQRVDDGLLGALSRHAEQKRIYLMTHFDHPREVSPESIAAIRRLQDAGVTLLNQHPIIRGVNDTAPVLRELFTAMSENRIMPYYSFICRPTAGNEESSVPIEESLAAFTEAQSGLSGIERTARLMMSHITGKIEVLGMDASTISFRMYRPADPADIGKVVQFPRDPHARWFDEYAREQQTARVSAPNTGRTRQDDSNAYKRDQKPNGRNGQSTVVERA